MSRQKFESLSEQERADMASRVKTLRQARGLSQGELAREAGTSRQTISNMERGMVPHPKTLRGVLMALGVISDGLEFEGQTEVWLTMMGKLIEQIPSERRDKHVHLAMADLAMGIAGPSTNVLQFPDVSGGTDYEDGFHQAVASHMEGGVEDDDDDQE